jgi:hypothetical protein
MERYAVAYAKITTNKDGINLQGVYFGGVGNTIEEANQVAKDCVNRIRGGTILSKVIELDGQNTLLDALMDASDKFEAITLQMQEAEAIINRTQRNSS